MPPQRGASFPGTGLKPASTGAAAEARQRTHPAKAFSSRRDPPEYAETGSVGPARYGWPAASSDQCVFDLLPVQVRREVGNRKCDEHPLATRGRFVRFRHLRRDALYLHGGELGVQSVPDRLFQRLQILWIS